MKQQGMKLSVLRTVISAGFVYAGISFSLIVQVLAKDVEPVKKARNFEIKDSYENPEK